MKATHKGTCQICGRMQALPKGLLAMHGYDTAHGFFNGICRGSGNLPYELSCDMILESIGQARLIAAAKRGNADGLPGWAKTYEAAGKAWVHVYHPELSTRSRGPVRIWELVPISPLNGGPFYGYIKGGRVHALHTHSDLAGVIDSGNEHYAEHLRRHADQLDEYATRQEQRLKYWQPQALTPVSAK
jgi:hypothetical protein